MDYIRELKQTKTTARTETSMSKTIAVHVRYKSLYISLPSSAKPQREMTKFCVVWGTRTMRAKLSYFYLELNDAIAYLAWSRLRAISVLKKSRQLRILLWWNINSFWLAVLWFLKLAIVLKCSAGIVMFRTIKIWIWAAPSSWTLLCIFVRSRKLLFVN